MSHNRLNAERSPYLLQHKDNPVWWYAWGEEAFSAARKKNLPIFLSIGYSTCYWCHVMERDSFEHEDVAELLNKDFISIKLDREERPDIDQIYMDAVVGLTGHGGWPMSVFLTPDLKPFWGGTFFYRDKFKQIVSALGSMWRVDRGSLVETAGSIVDALQHMEREPSGSIDLSHAISMAVTGFVQSFDSEHGGFGTSPKFPPAIQLAWLARYASRTKDKNIFQMLQKTLRSMAYGGIYDHLGGGFARYSTDENWCVPHFEKMLYDNALLARIYLEGYQLTADIIFKEVAEETIEYALREMCTVEGAFFAAQDAGEAGAEGEFYVWKDSELRNLLSREQYEAFTSAYDIRADGNFENGSNVLCLRENTDWNLRSVEPVISARRRLFKVRAMRPAPRRDQKILTAWNALFISALTKGYQVLRNEQYLQAAVRSAEFILSQMEIAGQLLRSFCGGEARHAGCLDDYVYLVAAFLDLYESDFRSEWLRAALRIQALQDNIFWDSEKGGYFYSAAPELLIRKKDIFDNATPSANALTMLNLLRLYGLSAEEKTRARYSELKSFLGSHILQHPTAVATALTALEFEMAHSKQIVLAREREEQAADFISAIQSGFLPNKVFSVKTLDVSKEGTEFPQIHQAKLPIAGKPTVYVCSGHVCQAPETDLERAKSLIFA